MADGVVRHRASGVVDLREDGSGARVGDADAAALGRVEHVDGAAEVDRRSEWWIRLDLRDQKRREVNDVRDPVLVEHAIERRAIGDVSAHDLDSARSHETEAPVVGAEIEADDRGT